MNFKFFFHLMLSTAYLSVFAYGIGQKLVEQHATLLSFCVLGITVVCIAGMMRNLPALSPVKVKSK